MKKKNRINRSELVEILINMAFKILNKKIFLSRILITFQLINIILADNSNNKEFDSKNIIFLKVKGSNNIQKIISQNFISD